MSTLFPTSLRLSVVFFLISAFLSGIVWAEIPVAPSQRTIAYFADCQSADAAKKTACMTVLPRVLQEAGAEFPSSDSIHPIARAVTCPPPMVTDAIGFLRFQVDFCEK